MILLQTSLDNVRKLLSQSKTLQAVNKMHQLTDWYNINGNYVYIARWSVFTCVVIVITSCVQLIFVRRLFSTSSVTPNAKPRAWRMYDVIVYCCRSLLYDVAVVTTVARGRCCNAFDSWCFPMMRSPTAWMLFKDMKTQQRYHISATTHQCCDRWSKCRTFHITHTTKPETSTQRTIVQSWQRTFVEQI